MQITNTNGTRSVADRIPDMVETNGPVSEKIITTKWHNGEFYEILITTVVPPLTEYNSQARVVRLQHCYFFQAIFQSLEIFGISNTGFSSRTLCL
jgi:hypothetical protein